MQCTQTCLIMLKAYNIIYILFIINILIRLYSYMLSCINCVEFHNQPVGFDFTPHSPRLRGKFQGTRSCQPASYASHPTRTRPRRRRQETVGALAAAEPVVPPGGSVPMVRRHFLVLRTRRVRTGTGPVRWSRRRRFSERSSVQKVPERLKKNPPERLDLQVRVRPDERRR